MKIPLRLRGALQCACSPRPISRPTFQAQRTVLSKKYATVPGSSAIRAAPEINFKGGKEGEEDAVFYARLIPDSPSYFTAHPTFTDDFLQLQYLLRKYSTLPVVKPGEAPRVSWRSITEYRNITNETITSSKFHKISAALQRLNHIHPTVMPPEVTETLNRYKRDLNPVTNTKKLAVVDAGGRAVGAGRRKSSTATAHLVEGTGEVLINGKSLAEAFGRVHDRESAIWALKATDRIDKYNVWAIVSGGGTTGQAEALTLAVAKALLAHEPALKPALRRGKASFSVFTSCVLRLDIRSQMLTFDLIAGCVTRDPRRVERKKPGKLKARKMPAWVKR
jgi:small subunit ribosomal protein S9